MSIPPVAGKPGNRPFIRVAAKDKPIISKQKYEALQDEAASLNEEADKLQLKAQEADETAKQLDESAKKAPPSLKKNMQELAQKARIEAKTLRDRAQQTLQKAEKKQAEADKIKQSLDKLGEERAAQKPDGTEKIEAPAKTDSMSYLTDKLSEARKLVNLITKLHSDFKKELEKYKVQEWHEKDALYLYRLFLLNDKYNPDLSLALGASGRIIDGSSIKDPKTLAEYKELKDYRELLEEGQRFESESEPVKLASQLTGSARSLWNKYIKVDNLELRIQKYGGKWAEFLIKAKENMDNAVGNPEFFTLRVMQFKIAIALDVLSVDPTEGGLAAVLKDCKISDIKQEVREYFKMRGFKEASDGKESDYDLDFLDGYRKAFSLASEALQLAKDSPYYKKDLIKVAINTLKNYSDPKSENKSGLARLSEIIGRAKDTSIDKQPPPMKY